MHLFTFTSRMTTGILRAETNIKTIAICKRSYRPKIEGAVTRSDETTEATVG